MTLKSQCLISFGSNLGSRDCLIAEAARIISKIDLVESMETSRLFETPPIGGPSGQEPFLNAVAAFETTGTAREILEMLQEVEQRLGRERKRRWDARSIDLDVVLHGELVGGGTGLIVPHPRYTARQFVLQPACDVASHYRDPRFGWTIAELTAHLNSAPPSIALTGGNEALREEMCQKLNQQHGIVTFTSTEEFEAFSSNESSPGLSEKTEVLADAQKLNEPTPATNRHTPVSSPQSRISTDNHQDPINPQGSRQSGRKLLGDAPWVSSFVPNIQHAQGKGSRTSNLSPARTESNPLIPRLIGRIQVSTTDSPWPAPHQMWPSGWNWPEYRLEINDRNWAVSELFSALDSMRCPVRPITEDGNWWT